MEKQPLVESSMGHIYNTHVRIKSATRPVFVAPVGSLTNHKEDTLMAAAHYCIYFTVFPARTKTPTFARAFDLRMAVHL